MGSPQTPTPHEYERLENAGQLQLLGSPSFLPIERGAVQLQFTLAAGKGSRYSASIGNRANARSAIAICFLKLRSVGRAQREHGVSRRGIFHEAHGVRTDVMFLVVV